MLWLTGHAAASKVLSPDRAHSSHVGHFKPAVQVTYTSFMVQSRAWDIRVFWEIIHPETA